MLGKLGRPTPVKSSNFRSAALAELVVKPKHRSTTRIDQFQLLDDFRGILFLLNLLRDEPLQHHLGRIILFFLCQFEKGIIRPPPRLLLRLPAGPAGRLRHVR